MKSGMLGFVVSLVFATAGTRAQAAAPSEKTNSGQTEPSLVAGTAINVALDSSVDSKKAKQGDTVVAHTTDSVRSADGRTILPKGTKLIGHVTRVSSRSNGESESMLGMQFDKAKMKDGQEVPLGPLMVQAVAAPSREASSYGSPTERTTTPGVPSNNPSQSGSRGARPDNSGPPTTAYPGAEPAPNGETNAAGPLPPNTRGVFGLDGLSLASNSSTGATVIASKGKNVHLDSGTRLLLVPQQQASSSTPAQ
jgi:hypothetical protein